MRPCRTTWSQQRPRFPDREKVELVMFRALAGLSAAFFLVSLSCSHLCLYPLTASTVVGSVFTPAAAAFMCVLEWNRLLTCARLPKPHT
jgi:hypothetical protein